MATGKKRQKSKSIEYLRFQFAISNFIFLISLSLCLPSSQGNAATPVRPRGCLAIAKVTSSPKSSDLGRTLCKQQDFELPAKTEAVCRESLLVIAARTAKDLDLCDVPLKRYAPCDPTNPNDKRPCEILGRGSLNAKRPLLIAPYGGVLLPQATDFLWKGVDGADRYRIVLDSDRGRIKQVTNDTKAQLELHEGTVSIVTQAMKGDQVLSSSVRTFDVLSQVTAKAIARKLKQIDDFSSPPSEKNLIKVAILNHDELLNESIGLLENKVDRDKSTILTRVLADLYLRVGMLYQSRSQYKEAISLAEVHNDTSELKKAEEGYNLVSSILSNYLKPRS